MQYTKIIFRSLWGIALMCGSPALSAPPTRISIPLFENEIRKRIPRTEEFALMRKKATELGVRVWLFGGTAASVANYVYEDLKREAGDGSYSKVYFDYTYPKIFRSTRDIDLVVDGPDEAVSAFQSFVFEELRYFTGEKGRKWEMRGLTKGSGVRGEVGHKEAILDGFDFQNQDTDTYSVGLIEVSESSESVVRDARHWNSKEPSQFLKDITNGEIHFLLSPTHKSTHFYLEGNNPEIIAVIRLLTKAFQFGANIPLSSLNHVNTIVREFDPVADTQSSYVQGRIDEVAKRMIMHSVDMERSFAVIEKLGLLEKLLRVPHIHNKDAKNGVEDMFHWLSRSPLKSFDVGTGDGRTLREIAEKDFKIPWEEFIVAHDTRDFSAWESLTKARNGKANVLATVHGTRALHFTQVGKEGAWANGMTVRYKPDPNAREGSDFTVENDHIVFANSNVIHVIPEEIELTAIEMLENIEALMQQNPHNTAYYRQHLRILKTQLIHNHKEAAKIKGFIKKILKDGKYNSEVLRVFFSNIIANQVPELWSLLEANFKKRLISLKKSEYQAFFADIFSEPQVIPLIRRFLPELIATADQATLQYIIEHFGAYSSDVANDEPFYKYPELILLIAQHGSPETLRKFAYNHALDNLAYRFTMTPVVKEGVLALIDRGDNETAENVLDALSRAIHWEDLAKHKGLFLHIAETGNDFVMANLVEKIPVPPERSEALIEVMRVLAKRGGKKTFQSLEENFFRKSTPNAPNDRYFVFADIEFRNSLKRQVAKDLKAGEYSTPALRIYFGLEKVDKNSVDWKKLESNLIADMERAKRSKNYRSLFQRVFSIPRSDDHSHNHNPWLAELIAPLLPKIIKQADESSLVFLAEQFADYYVKTPILDEFPQILYFLSQRASPTLNLELAKNDAFDLLLFHASKNKDYEMGIRTFIQSADEVVLAKIATQLLAYYSSSEIEKSRAVFQKLMIERRKPGAKKNAPHNCKIALS